MLVAALFARTFFVNGNARCSSKYHSSSSSCSSEKGLLTLIALIGPLLNRTTACQPSSISPRSCILISCAMPTSPYFGCVVLYAWTPDAPTPVVGCARPHAGCAQRASLHG